MFLQAFLPKTISSENNKRKIQNSIKQTKSNKNVIIQQSIRWLIHQGGCLIKDMVHRQKFAIKHHRFADHDTFEQGRSQE